ncbi:hypothetical protein [Methanolobus halotolerans]|uniref:hypothetical protein n=1 Tax=Methanolobus halotolerans TaxID=2052935 RepID=UPI00197B8174|nr:hypothetical protein [Methanolobus halotolerans]
MGFLALIGSALLFVTFALTVLFILVAISSRLAMLTLLIVPIMAVIVLPGTSLAFLSYRHFLFADGLVPVNNFHILLTIWSTLIGIIIYTEFLTWYLKTGKRKRTEEQKTESPKSIIGKLLDKV